MKNIIVSIYPDCNGQFLVEANMEETKIKFVSKRRNLLTLMAITRLKIIKNVLKKRLSFS
jgi:hypothetical protein